MSPFVHMWDLVSRRLTRDPLPVVSKEKLWLRVKAIWNSLPQTDIQKLFDSMLCRIVELIAAHDD